MSSRTAEARTSTGINPLLVGVLDTLAVIVFATVGRSSHGGVDSAWQVLAVAAPFLVGLAVGSFLARWVVVRGRPPESLVSGAVALVGVLVVGLGYRIVVGAGAPAFLLVAALSLTLLLLGWRLLAAGVRRLAVRGRRV